LPQHQKVKGGLQEMAHQLQSFQNMQYEYLQKMSSTGNMPGPHNFPMQNSNKAKTVKGIVDGKEFEWQDARQVQTTHA
jgi:hypothetical protein